MSVLHRTSIVAVLFLLSVSPLRGQTAPPVAGHWEGSVQIQGMELIFQVDLAKDAGGQFIGAITVPTQKLKGLPLTKVVVDGTSVRFQARDDQPMSGTISDDGTSMTGDFTANGMSFPFSLSRTGDPRVAPLPASAPIG